MKNILKCKATRNEIRFTKANKVQKRLTDAELIKYRDESEKEGIDKIKAKIRSLYYGQPANKYKDARKRKNWCVRHNVFAD